jgi:hypothetical protein
VITATDRRSPQCTGLGSGGNRRRIVGPDGLGGLIVLALDLEATCDAPKSPQPQEVIEVGAVLLDGRRGCRADRPLAEFHSHARPTIRPELSAFCVDFTGVTQEQVDAAPPLDALPGWQSTQPERCALGCEPSAHTEHVSCPLADHSPSAAQGPQAVAAIATLAPGIAQLTFMGVGKFDIAGVPAIVSRSGYTGEDGVEVSVPAEQAETFARALLALPGVAPAGLGARDSLRLEAGLCLYGNDLDETTSPVEANLVWTMGKRRRMAFDFLGADRVRQELDDGAKRLRVGILPEGRQPARGHTPIHARGGALVGEVTSGGFGPSVNGPVAMGYVARDAATDNAPLDLMVRGKALPARIAALPFTPHRYAR